MRLAKIHAIINFFSGAWPALHLRSFEKVTGPKQDEWLVKTISWLFILSSVALWKASKDEDVRVLGIGWPAIIGGADIYYALFKNRIKKVYLIDAAVQMSILTAWLQKSRKT
jgi:hypothetical protein